MATFVFCAWTQDVKGYSFTSSLSRDNLIRLKRLLLSQLKKSSILCSHILGCPGDILFCYSFIFSLMGV